MWLLADVYVCIYVSVCIHACVIASMQALWSYLHACVCEAMSCEAISLITDISIVIYQKVVLVQEMAWRRKTTSPFLIKCWQIPLTFVYCTIMYTVMKYTKFLIFLIIFIIFIYMRICIYACTRLLYICIVFLVTTDNWFIPYLYHLYYMYHVLFVNHVMSGPKGQ